MESRPILTLRPLSDHLPGTVFRWPYAWTAVTRTPVKPHVAADVAAATLPLSLSVAAWLLRDRPVEPPRVGVSVARESALDCARLGASLVSGSSRVGLLIMGDGSACHGPKSPGYDDPRATSFDADVTSALAACDTEALLALDVDLATDLLVAGRAPWQVLAGAIDASGGAWTGSVTYADAPYGVQYTVATWLPVGVDMARAA